MSDFDEGVLVQLKSGGPNMTCAGKPDPSVMSGKVNCHWFVGTKLESVWFSPKALVVAEEPGAKKK